MLITAAAIFWLTAIVFYICTRHIVKRQFDPPGPLGLPIVGSITERIWLWMKQKKYCQNEFYETMNNTYGSLWSRYILGEEEFGVSNFDLIQEINVNYSDLFLNRPEMRIFELMSKDGGIIFLGRNIWQKNRKLTLHCWKDLEMAGHIDYNKLMARETENLLFRLQQYHYAKVESNLIFSKSVMSVIKQIVIGKEYDESDDAVINSLRNIGHDGNVHGILLLIHFLKWSKFGFLIPKVKRFMKNLKYAEEWCIDICNKATSSFDINNDRPTCLLEHYLAAYSNKKRLSENPITKFTQSYEFLQIWKLTFDMMTSGLDTTTYMLSWCILELCLRKDIQKKVREEIMKKVTNQNELLTYDVVKSVDYFIAFTNEVLRLHPVVPRSMRAVEKTVKLHGYSFTPSQMIVLDYKNALRDPFYWPKPNEFRPERFLDSETKQYVPNKYLVAFGMGKRNCMGQKLARMEFSVFLANVLIRYEVELHNKCQLDIDEIMRGTDGIVHAPLKHEVIFSPLT